MPDGDVNLVAFYKVAPVDPVPPPSAGGWTLNGSAALSDRHARTHAERRETSPARRCGPQPVATDGLRASFDATIDQGTGADGLTFALPRSVGGANALGGPVGRVSASARCRAWPSPSTRSRARSIRRTTSWASPTPARSGQLVYVATPVRCRRCATPPTTST